MNHAFPLDMSYTHGIDISAYQHRRGIDWDALGGSRYRVLVAKLSEGIGGSQLDICLEHGEQARRRGWDFSVYHFVDKQMRYTASEEAKAFLKLFVKLCHLCSIPPTLDVEPKGTGDAWGALGRTRAEVGLWAQDWAKRAGITPIIYTPAGRSYVPTLLAASPKSPRWLSTRPWHLKSEAVDRPPAEPGWHLAPAGADVWQYASRCAGVAGVKGNCDRNVFRDVCALRTHWRDQT